PRRFIATAAFGPVLVCRRDAFLEHVAHPSVRGAVLDDVALARRFAAAGEPIMLFGGGPAPEHRGGGVCGFVDFRMYRRVRDLVEGWAKNFAAGAGATPPLRLVLIVAWVTACLVSGWGAVAGTAVALTCYGIF